MWDNQSANTQSIIHYLLKEILLRVVLIAIVCLFSLKVQPRNGILTESELFTHYKCPRVDSYVPPWAIVVIVVFVPLLCFYIEFTRTQDYVDCIQAMLAWTLALSLNALVTESLKLIVGRPRPDYFYRCFPNGTITSGLLCTGSIRDMIEGRKSFPSGHSSFSFCSLGFLSLWISGKLMVFSTYRRYNYRTLACLTPYLVAGIVSSSRRFDNHHHWGDILAGSILGLAASYFCYRQYYHSLCSNQSGEPLTTMTADELFQSYQLECCTRSLSEDICLMFDISPTSSLDSNMKLD